MTFPNLPKPPDTTALAEVYAQIRTLSSVLQAQTPGGTIAVPISGTTGSETGSVNVTFAVPLPSAPVVVATPQGANVTCWVSSVTTTGFTMTARRIVGSGAGSPVIGWVAFPL